MAKKDPRRSDRESKPEIESALSAMTLPRSAIGERRNYNLQAGVTGYRHWPFSTVEWVVEEGQYRTRSGNASAASRAARPRRA